MGTHQRIVEPGLRARRAVCRFYLFRPDCEIRQAFLYCLGLAAKDFGIKLHAGINPGRIIRAGSSVRIIRIIESTRRINPGRIIGSNG